MVSILPQVVTTVVVCRLHGAGSDKRCLNLESLIIQLNDARLTKPEEIIWNQQASLQNLEHQVAQMSMSLVEHLEGSLLSNTEVNPLKSHK